MQHYIGRYRLQHFAEIQLLLFLLKSHCFPCLFFFLLKDKHQLPFVHNTCLRIIGFQRQWRFNNKTLKLNYSMHLCILYIHTEVCIFCPQTGNLIPRERIFFLKQTIKNLTIRPLILCAVCNVLLHARETIYSERRKKKKILPPTTAVPKDFNPFSSSGMVIFQYLHSTDRYSTYTPYTRTNHVLDLTA